MPTDEWFVAGRIVGVYGVKGWLRVQSFTDPEDNLMQYYPWRIETRQGQQELAVVDIKPQNKGYIVKLEGIDDRDEAAAYRQQDISVPVSSLEPVQNGYYWRDLIGLKVCNLQDQVLGHIDHLLETGANDVMVIKTAEGNQLIPYIQGNVVKQIDLQQQQMQVDWDPSWLE